MGTKLSKTKNCVAVWCEKPVYQSGEIVKGYVLLNVYEPFAATLVTIEVTGSECSHWETTSGTGEEEKTWSYRGSNTFFQAYAPLYKFGGAQLIPVGQYQFSFHVQLPDHLPSSYRYTSWFNGFYKDIYAEIIYKVTAEVVWAPTAAKIAHLKDILCINVRQRAPMRIPKALLDEQTTLVRCCCFSGMGAVTIRGRLEKDMYEPGEALNVVIEIENRSKKGFQDVVVSVCEQLELRSAASSCTLYNIICKHTLNALAKGQSLVGTNAQRLTFRLPTSLPPTTTTASLVRSTYCVFVALSAGLLISIPKLILPFSVYTRPHIIEACEPSAPSFWRPQVVGPVVALGIPCCTPPAVPAAVKAA